MDTRERMLHAAADMLARGGRDAVSTRAVSAAAGVTAPTLYRLFGDKEGLLHALANYGFQQYLAEKQTAMTDDPVADLRSTWHVHVNFGLSHPAIYALMFGSTPSREGDRAGREALAMLRDIISRIAAHGRLRVSVDEATQLFYATGVGVTLMLIATPPADRDLDLATTALDHLLRATTTDAEPAARVPGVALRAVALREALRHDDQNDNTLTTNEQALLADWLDRLAAGNPTSSA
ncbi:TetR/AcrR family transcriptional regulator [Nonomuraea terrae]|uniref:TetR/AcrR family transcriptional regulator n=1 Tax=Nonomuraea terrae TaxID=2530383 RepID=A0A4R4Z5A5_9ACTN|nr:TetR/AcrR family transcriptional regulator [Nonomuraea terrae]TDD53278.1 TetR/AcrR family transcriptional regulator [Nonomuraea terrae]